MKPLHEELKAIRLKKGISLQEISDKTKIRLDYLERIEDGDFTVTPLPFLRAFLREYAEVLKIEPCRVMLRFDNKVESILSEEQGEKSRFKKNKLKRRKFIESLMFQRPQNLFQGQAMMVLRHPLIL